MNINLEDVISSLSTALDLSQLSSQDNILEEISNMPYDQNKFLYHSKTTTYIAMEICKELSIDKNTINRTYISSMLHDIGGINNMHSNHRNNNFIKNHCIQGANTLKYFPQFRDLNKIILYHHENYNGSGPLSITSNSIPIESQIIRMADLIDSIFNRKTPSYNQKNNIINWINQNTNIIFNPMLVDIFNRISIRDNFWFNIENISFIPSIFTSIIPDLNIYISLDEFREISLIFAKIIDSISPFTAKHSIDIGNLAYIVSKYIGYEEEKCTKMEIAGFLHDIGKIAIPPDILSKPGALTKDEYSIIKSHVYYTNIILKNIKNAEDITEWASNHHEKLNGDGYPIRLNAKNLSMESRLLAVCDIYQALTEKRPYRNGLSPKESFDILDKMSKENLVCNKALDILKGTLSCNNLSDNKGCKAI
ncbi:HD domain-containing protein [Clostridium sp. MSJ-4]|uniref:HD domain-containing protein n=1 Tax=Clostridium simiarum TaxID=2841506 RepID=A0ABS6EVU1_9CLOT|nr:HD domain-containing phosphohydrolase [Clostridium simiarum]MBU5590344.1 HD domain-containing protein [Clostridium simiarum]